MKKGILYILATLITLKVLLFSTGCANIVPPTGGPKDTLAPVLISVTPRDSSLQFKSNKIVFTFDEYVDAQNTQEEVIVSPTTKTNPIIDHKLRTVTVRIKDTLEPNTTYSINFGNSIRDINEGNIAKQFTYIFSTGSTIDNFEFSGNVILAQTGKIDTTLIAMLHRSADDSAVVKERPRYYTRLDNKGNFRFRNLAAGTYYLYTIKDEGGSRRYFGGSQLFGFADKPVVVAAETKRDTLYAYVQKVEEKKAKNTQPATTSTKEKKDAKKDEDKRLRFQTNLESGQQDLLGDFQFIFESPLKTFDSTKIIFTDEKFQPLSYSLIRDTLNTHFTFIYKWQENTAYHFILDKEFAADSAGKKLSKTDTLNFKSKKIADYGALRLRLPNLDLKRHPVLNFLQGEKIILSYVMTSKEYNTKLFKPGEYDINILYDDNQNGKWDPGDFFGKHLQPEKVQSIPLKLKIKANWDNEQTVPL